MAIGRPLGPILADISVAHIEANTALGINDLVHYCRCMNDVLIINTNTQQVGSIHAIICRAHSNISVSLQYEINDILTFVIS